jgi:hypothetical protein
MEAKARGIFRKHIYNHFLIRFFVRSRDMPLSWKKKKKKKKKKKRPVDPFDKGNRKRRRCLMLSLLLYLPYKSFPVL